MFLQLALSALIWGTVASVISLAVSLILLWFFGLSPKRLAREINDVQNAGVGTVFFVVSLITSLFVSVLAGGIPTTGSEPILEELAWIGGGVVLAGLFTWVSVLIAHKLMAPKGEKLSRYLHREIIDEQNVALALFLGGLALPPFLAFLYQIL